MGSTKGGNGVVGASQERHEAVFVITGLTPGSSLTWDAAIGVEVASSSSQSILWGGPNNSTASDAQGAYSFEIFDATDLLAGTNYDPGTAATKGTAASALAAFDTTNLRLTFTVPSSGNVQVRILTVVSGATTASSILLGVLEGSTVRGRISPLGALPSGLAAGSHVVQEAVFVVTGLTPGASLTWDAAWGIETFVASSLIKYGGPNDATASNAFGATIFEIWAVG
jgi:hypothetical protein